jgi:hypothetical protein
MAFRFNSPNCPECGEPLVGILENMPALFYVEPTDDGSFEYAGDYAENVECSRPIVSESGVASPLAWVECSNAHQWQTIFETVVN